MSSISKATYVFLDLGTTNDPKDKSVKIITELSMSAVRRDRLLEAGLWYVNDNINFWTEFAPPVPRVQLKLTLCFNPGTDEELLNGRFRLSDLKPERTFDECFEVINDFLNILPDPVYFVAHNGFTFDFPILKRHLKGKSFSKDIMCVDTYYGFYDILETNSPIEASIANVTASLAAAGLDDSVRTAEETKKHLCDLRQANADRVKRTKGYPWGKMSNKPGKSYQLADVYERVMKHKSEDSHKCDIDCQLMLRIAVKFSKEFVAWADENHSSFAEHVEPRASQTQEAGAIPSKSSETSLELQGESLNY